MGNGVRLQSTGCHSALGSWLVEREAEIVHGRHHGWIDLVAFRARPTTMVVIKIKTRLDDIGAVERQLAWYQRSASTVARRLGWRPAQVIGWLLALATDEVEDVLRLNWDLFAGGFQRRAHEMGGLLRRTSKLA